MLVPGPFRLTNSRRFSIGEVCASGSLLAARLNTDGLEPVCMYVCMHACSTTMSQWCFVWKHLHPHSAYGHGMGLLSQHLCVLVTSTNGLQSQRRLPQWEVILLSTLCFTSRSHSHQVHLSIYHLQKILHNTLPPSDRVSMVTSVHQRCSKTALNKNTLHVQTNYASITYVDLMLSLVHHPSHVKQVPHG